MRRFAGAIFFTFASAGTASADSDGYFCVGNGYIAYQFGLAAPPIAPHRLTIVRFGSDGFQAAQVVDLPQFQVHGMECRDSTVRIRAYDRIYTVDLDSIPRVVGHADIPLADRGHFPSDSFVSDNLGRLSRVIAGMRTERKLLGESTNGHSFELVIIPTPSPKQCTVDIRSALVELDTSGQRVTSLEVFRGEGYFECNGASPAA